MNEPATKAKRPSMLSDGRTVSFKIEERVKRQAVKRARNRKIPFSMWMREAAEEKMARENVAA